MEHLQNPLMEGFKEKYKWWSAIELGRRFVSVAFIIFFPRAQVWALSNVFAIFKGLVCCVGLPVTISLHCAGALWPHSTLQDLSH